MQGSTTTGDLAAGIVDNFGNNRQFRNSVYVQIEVTEDGEWVGDFFVEFEKQRLGGSDKYVADWDSVKSGGNGIYVDDDPCFWPVEEVVDELNERFSLHEFVALNTGPRDI